MSLCGGLLKNKMLKWRCSKGICIWLKRQDCVGPNMSWVNCWRGLSSAKDAPCLRSMGVAEHLHCMHLQRIDQRVQNLGTALPPPRCSQATGLHRPYRDWLISPLPASHPPTHLVLYVMNTLRLWVLEVVGGILSEYTQSMWPQFCVSFFIPSLPSGPKSPKSRQKTQTYKNSNQFVL